jgi:hypothetical protein
MSAAPLPKTPSKMDEYLFDLNGFLVLKGAIAPDHVEALNGILDRIVQLNPPLSRGEWYGGVHAHGYGGKEGINLQQIYEGGEPFERLIDNPNWIELVEHFIGAKGTFDMHHGPLFIDENFANIRGPGEAIGLHSGGHNGTVRTSFRFRNGGFHCGQINILMALNDIGPGDGATMVIPGSHKANLPHPQLGEKKMKTDQMTSVDGTVGAIEVHLQKGDALLFVDAINHGSAERRNPGQRRICVYRYGPSWGFFRHPYRPTRQLLERLTDRQRKIVWPHEALRREPNRLPDTPVEPIA